VVAGVLFTADRAIGDVLLASFLKHERIEMSRVPYRDVAQQPATNLAEGRIRLYPRDTIQYRDGARIIARSDREKPLGMKDA